MLIDNSLTDKNLVRYELVILEIAKLCMEAAPAAENAGDKETAKRWFQRAAKIMEKEGTI